MTTKTIKKTKRGRSRESFEKRDYYHKYKSNLHTLLENPATVYQLTRVLLTNSALNAARNAKNQGCMPTKKTFTTIAKALYKIDRGKSGMTESDYSLWLMDEAETK